MTVGFLVMAFADLLDMTIGLPQERNTIYCGENC